MRIVLTVVGLSLLEEWLNRDVVGLVEKLAKDDKALLPSSVRIDVLPQQLTDMREHMKRIKQDKRPPTTEQADYSWQVRRQPVLAAVTEIIRAVWRADWSAEAELRRVSAERIRREHAPAELASLSLLDPKLKPEDQVWLLYSETCAGAFCSAILAEVLRNPGNGSTLCDGGVTVRPPQMLAGVQIDNPKRLKEVGLESWASVLETAWRTLRETDDKVLLNITGGYKGLAPLGTLLAFGLGSPGRPIEVIYLYEESDQLLSLPGSDLVYFDLAIFDRFAKNWDEMPAEGLPWPDTSDVLTGSFVDQVVKKRPDMLTIAEGRLQLTVTGHLLLAVWHARQAAGRARAPQTDVE